MPYFDFSQIAKILEEADELFSDNLSVKNEGEVTEIYANKKSAQLWCLGITEQVYHALMAGAASQAVVSTSNLSNAAFGVPLGDFTKIGNTFLKNEKFTPGFVEKVIEISQRLSIPYTDLLVAMSFETGGTFSPSIKNKKSGATGLIQFMPSTAIGLGTTVDKLAQMSQVEQLDYVEKYLKNKNLAGKTFGDIYMSILFPVAIGKADDFVLFGPGAIRDKYVTKGYTQNKGLDLDKDGKITKAEAVKQAWDRGIKNLS